MKISGEGGGLGGYLIPSSVIFWSNPLNWFHPQGICDNLLTCTTRAWSPSKPLLVCPAMNTRMWEHPVTGQQLALLSRWGHRVIPPITKTLMCGETGVGAMAEVDTIVQEVKMLRTLKESEQWSWWRFSVLVLSYGHKLCCWYFYQQISYFSSSYN